MSTHKMEQMKKNNHKNVRRNINKLFNRLKRDSIGSRNNSQNHSQSSLDSTPCNLTIVVKNDSYTSQRKRKSPVTVDSGPSKSRRKSDSLIVINDDDLSTNNDSCILISPTKTTTQNNNNINCSTPKVERNSQTLQNLIINNFPKTKSLSCTQPNETKQENRTKLINRDSYLTIDLTADSENKTNPNVTVIDLDKCPENNINDSQDCSVVSVSNASLSMSGDSDVTVIQNNKKSKNKQIKKFTNGIAQLNPNEKANLLKIIAQKIFSGCDLNNGIQNAQMKVNLCFLKFLHLAC